MTRPTMRHAMIASALAIAVAALGIRTKASPAGVAGQA